MRPSSAAIGTSLRSFQSSSDPKAGCDSPDPRLELRVAIVSILIRPEGRMRPGLLRDGSRSLTGFQSSSDPKAGCDWLFAAEPTAMEEFQSSSDPKAGCDAVTLE